MARLTSVDSGSQSAPPQRPPAASKAAATAAAAAMERAVARDREEGLYSIGEDRDEGRCRQVDRLARQFRIDLPKVGEWVHMLTEVLDSVPVAVTVVDMKVPSLPMHFCNPAMCALTGYSKAELEGNNCRMLQGEKTEPEAVHEMVASIRTARRNTIFCTNYRRDGTAFINKLTMQPVRDKAGIFRYCLGVLCDTATEDNVHKLGKLLQVIAARSLPDSCPIVMR